MKKKECSVKMVKVKVEERFDHRKNAKVQSSCSKEKIHAIRIGGVDSSKKKSIGVKLLTKKLQCFSVGKSLNNLMRRSWESYISLAVRLFALLLLSWMIVEETNVYNKNPTGTVVENDLYPIQNIEFPGIAICNINLMSRARTHNLAEELWLVDRVREMENVTLDRLKDLLKYLGHLFTFRNWEQEAGDLKLLEAILKTAFNGTYNLSKLMEEIVTRCRGVLKYCSWEGAIRSCDELFVQRWTQDGFCCTFNYVRWTESFDNQAEVDFKADIRRSKAVGPQFGLRIYMKPQLDDYYYTFLRGRGFKVLIYSASDYPDAPSGGLRELLINPRSDSYVELQATSFYSTPDIKKYDMRQRGCLFKSEQQDLFEGGYSYSQCMMLCRTREIFKTCGCVPFFYPTPSDLENSRDCDVSDLTCLHNNRMKWWSVAPELIGTMDDPMPIGADDFNEEKIDCDCLPACESVEYGTRLFVSEIHHSDTGWIDFVTDDKTDNTTMDSVLLTIRFGKTTIIRLKQDVLYYWYDLMSNYGGLCSLFLGLSVLTPIEIVYLWFSRKSNQRGKSIKLSTNSGIKKLSKLDDQAIYWREIIPKRRY